MCVLPIITQSSIGGFGAGVQQSPQRLKLTLHVSASSGAVAGGKGGIHCMSGAKGGRMAR
jgi:hypothetical protein